MTNKNRDNLDLLQIGRLLWVVAIGYLTIALTLAGLLIVHVNIPNLVLGVVFVALVALSGGSMFLSKKLNQLTKQTR
ncbi:MAG: hypothetical protein OXG88_05355 [Gammaproteobacteria bacterium]|nr:hypothetical protein [Gammaproteobacteria bacterium]